LDADQYLLRERASRELAEMGVFAESALTEAVQTTASAEVRARAKQLLDRLQRPVTGDPNQLRIVRAMQVLEQVGSQSAESLLKRISSLRVAAIESPQTNQAISPPANLQEPDWQAGSKPSTRQDCIEHKTRVFDVAFSPDGRYCASAGGQCHSGFVQVFEVETGEESFQFQTGLPAICLAYSPDGKTIATGGGGLYEPGMAAVDLWDASSGHRLRTFVGHTGTVHAIVFSPDGRWLVTGSHDGTVRLWDAQSGRERHRFDGHQYSVFDVAISPNGRYIASCGGKGHSSHVPGELKIWEVASGRQLYSLLGHHGPVFSVAFSPDGCTLASGGADKTVRLWSLSTGEEMDQLKGHQRPVYGVAFHPTITQVSAVAMRGAIKNWDTVNGSLASEFPMASTGRVFRLAFSPHGNCLATAGPGLAVNIWSTSTEAAR
jgi:WD40 repeat protein